MKGLISELGWAMGAGRCVVSGGYSRMGVGLVRLVWVRGLSGARAAPVEGLRPRHAHHAPPPPPAPPHASRRALPPLPPRPVQALLTLLGNSRFQATTRVRAAASDSYSNTNKYENSLHILVEHVEGIEVLQYRFRQLVLEPIISIGEALHPSTAYVYIIVNYK